jgi:hypothetical protein
MLRNDPDSSAHRPHRSNRAKAGLAEFVLEYD